MPTIRTRLCSSDSVDFEHAATFMDLEELAFTGEEQLSAEHSSPPISRETEFVPLSGDTNQTTSAIAIQKLSDPLQAPHISTANNKIAVYREENTTPRTDMHIDLPGHGAHCLRVACSETYGEAWMSRVEEQKPVVAEYTENAQALLKAGVTKVSNNTQLAHRLQSIASRRASLLQQLNDLQREEAEVLAMLTRATLGESSTSSSAASGSRPLDVTLPSKRHLYASKLPRLKPSKPFHKPVPLCHVSVSPMSTFSSTRSRTSSTLKRIPMGDKTKKSVKATCSYV